MSGPREAVPEGWTVDTDEPITRRTMLVAGGSALATGIAGCTVEAGQQPASRTLIDEPVRVSPGQYDSIQFTLESERWLTVSAVLTDRSTELKNDGPAVDVVVMVSEQYEQFQTDGTFSYVGGASMPDVVNGQVSTTVDAGEYVVLVDNTDRGSAKPDGSGVTAVVDLELTASTPKDQ